MNITELKKTDAPKDWVDNVRNIVKDIFGPLTVQTVFPQLKGLRLALENAEHRIAVTIKKDTDFIHFYYFENAEVKRVIFHPQDHFHVPMERVARGQPIGLTQPEIDESISADADKILQKIRKRRQARAEAIKRAEEEYKGGYQGTDDMDCITMYAPYLDLEDR